MKFNYVCEECKKETIEEQPIGSDALDVCPVCGSTSYRRVIKETHAVIYKGRGFYATDSKVERKRMKDSKKLHEAVEKEKEWQPPKKEVVAQPPPVS